MRRPFNVGNRAMAHISKQGARVVIAAGQAGVGWGQSGDQPGHYKISIRNHNTDRLFTVSLLEAEAMAFVDWVASHETYDWGCGTVDGRSRVEKLRALADKLEAEAK
jgi:hypothetical protein